jgi:hypothetical protein
MLQNTLKKHFLPFLLIRLSPEQKMHYTLRIASALCFFGHGAFGLITKPVWLNYFAIFGIGPVPAYRWMPIIGSLDLVMGILILLYPMRIILLWLVLWGGFTALLRPLSGEPFAEFIERAGNFGTPLVLLILSGLDRDPSRSWFQRIRPNRGISPQTLSRLNHFLRIVVFLFLLGHGWLNWSEKRGLLAQYASLGFPNPLIAAKSIGIFEMVAACMVLIRPIRSLVLALLIWKIGTEFFYPSHEVFEWVERGGSYGALLALWFVLGQVPASSSSPADWRSGN